MPLSYFGTGPWYHIFTFTGTATFKFTSLIFILLLSVSAGLTPSSPLSSLFICQARCLQLRWRHASKEMQCGNLRHQATKETSHSTVSAFPSHFQYSCSHERLSSSINHIQRRCQQKKGTSEDYQGQNDRFDRLNDLRCGTKYRCEWARVLAFQAARQPRNALISHSVHGCAMRMGKINRNGNRIFGDLTRKLSMLETCGQMPYSSLNAFILHVQKDEHSRICMVSMLRPLKS